MKGGGLLAQMMTVAVNPATCSTRNFKTGARGVK